MPVGFTPDTIPPAHNRRVIIVLEGSKIEQIKYEKKYNDLRKSIYNKSQVWLMNNAIEKYKDPATIVFLNKLSDDNLLDDGNVLVQSSDDTSKYFLVDEVVNKVILPKWDHYLTICNYLGATNIDIKITHIKYFGGNTGLKATICLLGFKLSQGVEFRRKNRKQLKYRTKFIIKRKPPNLKLAEGYVKKHSLEKDRDIQFMIDNCRDSTPVKLKRDINLFEQVQESMGVVTSLAIKDEYPIKFKTSFEKKIKETKRYTVNVNVGF